MSSSGLTCMVGTVPWRVCGINNCTREAQVASGRISPRERGGDKQSRERWSRKRLGKGTSKETEEGEVGGHICANS